MNQTTLHLIPSLLSEDGQHALPAYLCDLVSQIHIYFVEDLKTARRYLKKLRPQLIIDEQTFHLLNEHTTESLTQAAAYFKAGKTVAYISDAGCPGIADPGQDLVTLAHQHQAKIVPHVGPSSILLALMSSGFNGQHFHFHGYLPNKQPALTQKIKLLEMESKQTACSQIFIETPYRNNQLLQELIKTCHPATRICIAADLTSSHEYILTKTIADWKTAPGDWHKRPAVFLLFAG
ncbi:MAG: SAM-dependent methyltransferase [Chitinophagaceae bacterium]|nr:SAM-dependent methyltransferase [Chitinophagaceae bacterium]